MRTLFIIAAKLFGLYMLYGAVYTVISAASFALAEPPASLDTLWSMYLIVAVDLVFGVVLVFWPSRLAATFHIPDTQIATTMGAREALRIGILLIGLYLLVGGLPRTFESLLATPNATKVWVGWAHWLLQVFACLVPLYLLFSVDRMVDLLWRQLPRENSETPAPKSPS